LDRVLPRLFKVVEECEDKIAIEIGDRQCARLPLRVLGGEQDRHAQCVAWLAMVEGLALHRFVIRWRKKDSSSDGREERELMRYLHRQCSIGCQAE
jgi:hypothetical protein